MKKFYFLGLLLFAFSSSFATTKTLINSTSNMMDAAAWSGGQLPQAGDTVVIPAGKVLTLATNVTFPFSTVLLVYGEIRLGASAINIYLDAASKIYVYTGGKITGTSGSQRIYLNNQQIFNGPRTVDGAMWAGQFTNGFIAFPGGASTLPVKFVAFTVSHNNNDALIQWSTSQEINASMYEVQRSIDGANWNTIAYVVAVGNSSTLAHYSYTDKELSANVTYYRIKQIDTDGKSVFTSVVSIKGEKTYTVSNISIASIQNKVVLHFPQQAKGNVSVRFISMNGQVVDQQNISNPVGQVVLNSKVTGNYIISISNGQDINSAKQVLL